MAHEDLIQEASDPTTDPERLRELAQVPETAVHRAAWRNPSLPEDEWRKALLNPSLPEDEWRKALLMGHPEAWANPMALFYLLAWTLRKEDLINLEEGTRLATWATWTDPNRCSPEGKVLLNAKAQEWWATSESTRNMIRFLGGWAKAKGNGSVEHREVVRIVVLCVRTTPNLTDKDRQALDLLEAWTAGGQDRRDEAQDLAFSIAIEDTVRFAKDPSHHPWRAIFEVLEAIGYTVGTQAKAEHSRFLADLIRREMPLPPVVT